MAIVTFWAGVEAERLLANKVQKLIKVLTRMVRTSQFYFAADLRGYL